MRCFIWIPSSSSAVVPICLAIQKSVYLPCSRLLTWISMLPLFHNLRWSNNKMTMFLYNILRQKLLIPTMMVWRNDQVSDDVPLDHSHKNIIWSQMCYSSIFISLENHGKFEKCHKICLLNHKIFSVIKWLCQGDKARTLERHNERNFCYVRLALTSIFGLCFMVVCLTKSNYYSLIYSSLDYAFKEYYLVYQYYTLNIKTFLIFYVHWKSCWSEIVHKGFKFWFPLS